jgi:DNA-cytosine methyltransferase
MGWETVAFVEKDKFCQKVLRKNFGRDIEIHDDITTFSGKPFCGRVDIITGGFPCQPFSAAGKRKGRDDERHLFPAMLDVIRDVRPTWCVLENVRGLLNIESGKVFSEVISSLEGEGYEVVTFCIPASAVEAPHQRQRLWIVCHLSDSTSERLPLTGLTGLGELQTEDREGMDDRSQLSDCDASVASSLGRGSGSGDRQGRRVQGDERTASEGESEREGRIDWSSSIGSVPADSDNERHLRRKESSEDRERSIQAGRGNDRTLSKSSIGYSNVADSTGRIRRRTGGTQSHERPQILREAETQGKADQLNGSNSNASNAHIIGQPRPRKLAGRGDTAASGEGEVDRTFDDDEPEAGWREPWPQVAARLCRMDARVSQRVDRLKSLGNSIVPQIAFEIFKAIEASEKENNASA